MDIITVLGETILKLLLILSSLEETVLNICLVKHLQRLFSPFTHGVVHVVKVWYLHFLQRLTQRLLYLDVDVLQSERDLTQLWIDVTWCIFTISNCIKGCGVLCFSCHCRHTKTWLASLVIFCFHGFHSWCFDCWCRVLLLSVKTMCGTPWSWSDWRSFKLRLNSSIRERNTFALATEVFFSFFALGCFLKTFRTS